VTTARRSPLWTFAGHYRPGMAVFSKYAAVLEADGTPMSVRTALQLINRFLAEDDFDPDTQFCLHWFEQQRLVRRRLRRCRHTFARKRYERGRHEGCGYSPQRRRQSPPSQMAEYPSDLDPNADARLPVGKRCTNSFAHSNKAENLLSGVLLAALGGKAEAVRQLAYRYIPFVNVSAWLRMPAFTTKLITSWTGIESAAGAVPTEKTQGTLFGVTCQTGAKIDETVARNSCSPSRRARRHVSSSGVRRGHHCRVHRQGNA